MNKRTDTQSRRAERSLPKVAGILWLVVITILAIGCQNEPAIGGVENRPLAEFVGSSYKSDYSELFQVAAADTVKLGYDTEYSTVGKIVAYRTAEQGTVYLLECSEHLNYSSSQYPGYDETNPHSGCYLPLYVRSVTTQSVEWAAFWSETGAQGEGQYGSACFAAGSKEKAMEYLDLAKWNPQPTTSSATAQ